MRARANSWVSLTGRKLRVWWFLPLLALPALWPFLAHGLPASADGMLHLLRVTRLDEYIRMGVLYPRWFPELVLGYGYPLLSFYAPATYYLVELFHLAGADFPLAMITAYCLLIVAAGVGMWLFAADYFAAPGQPGANWAPLIAATAYMYSPYLLTNAYMRGAIAEVGAQALIPWIFWSFRRLLRRQQPARSLLAATLSLAALALTHNITLVLVPPVLLSYLLLLSAGTEHGARRLMRGLGAATLAAGASAFFWMPVIVERGYLGSRAYEISSTVFIPENIWSWHNWLDLHPTFEYTLLIPFQLGLAQVALAIAGIVVAGRRDREWLFWGGVALVAAICIGGWSVPVWLSSEILLSVQFPWRLLSIISFPLALFTGGLLSFKGWSKTRRALVGALIVMAIVVANRPHFPQWTPLPYDAKGETEAGIAAFEHVEGGLGTTFTGEFMPRWRDPKDHPADRAEPAGETDAGLEGRITVTEGGPYAMHAIVSSRSETTLRLATFYFPGWRVLLDETVPLEPRPETSLGLLTVDVPPGDHTLRVEWAGTSVQRIGGLVSLAALAALAISLLWFGAGPYAVAIPVVSLLVGVVATLNAPPVWVVRSPEQPVQADGIELLGYHAVHSDPAALSVYPYWYVAATPPDLQAHWRLVGHDGATLVEAVSRPRFGTVPADSLRPSMLFDDAYRIELPPDLPAGRYDLWLAMETVEDAADRTAVRWSKVGAVELATNVPPGPAPPPFRPAPARFGNSFLLGGYLVAVDGVRPPTSAGDYTIVRAGDIVEYTLFWKRLESSQHELHSFLHLLDPRGTLVAQRDKIPGSSFHFVEQWAPFYYYADSYRLTIPEDASGVYVPQVGLYDFDTLVRLPVRTPDGADAGTALPLPPLKVLSGTEAEPQYPAFARLGHVAELVGYDLMLPEGGVRPGSAVTIRLYYKSVAATTTNYTRFVHLFSPELGMAAQSDSPPQGGANPTPAWVPGEIIRDVVTLDVAGDARPGPYEVRVGLYDPAAGGRRLPLLDGDGRALPDDQLILTTLTVER